MNGNRTNQMAADQQLIDGLTTNAALVGSITIAGKQFKPADVVQVLQTRITAAKAATAAKANLTAASATAKNGLANTRAFIKAIRQALRLMFADDVNLLATFGLAPAKAPVTKPATQVEAAAKAKATREARGTKGKKQRLEIKAPTPPVESATPVPATSPAPTAKP